MNSQHLANHKDYINDVHLHSGHFASTNCRRKESCFTPFGKDHEEIVVLQNKTVIDCYNTSSR